MDTWGDTRLTVVGSEGYIEVRKNIDVAGRPGSDHLFLVDQKGTQYIDCSQVELPFGRQLLDDIRNRTQTALSQEHAFWAAELALHAQEKATACWVLDDTVMCCATPSKRMLSLGNLTDDPHAGFALREHTVVVSIVENLRRDHAD